MYCSPNRTEQDRATTNTPPPASRAWRDGDGGIRRGVPAAERRRALAAGPSQGGSLRDIKHVVILMQENRSFDHYFGTLPNVRGFSDPDAIKLSTGKSVFYQPDTANPDGYLLPFHLDTTTTSAQAQPSTSHAWAVQHSAWNNGAMNNWLPAHLAADGANGPYTMGYLDRDDIPFHYALAENFTICDNYHCSVLGPTWPNRLYHCPRGSTPRACAAARSSPTSTRPRTSWKTYPEALTAAGVPWQVYQEVDNYECNPLEMFDTFQAAPVSSTLYQNGLRTFPAGQFEYDAIHDRLPVGLLDRPDQLPVRAPGLHPGGGRGLRGQQDRRDRGQPRRVEQDRVHPQLRRERRPLRPRGAADRPRRARRASTSAGCPIGAGFRVPCLIVSPWTQGGWIASETFDHTSVLRFLERSPA